MSQKTEPKTNLEIADQMTARLQELRMLANRIRELEELVPVGSQLHRGIVLVHRDVQSAGHDLERLCAVARAMIV